MSSHETKEKQEIKQWEEFNTNVRTRGVFLIFEKVIIYPGDPIPDKFGPKLTPHYRLLTRHERRLKKKGICK